MPLPAHAGHRACGPALVGPASTNDRIGIGQSMARRRVRRGRWACGLEGARGGAGGELGHDQVCVNSAADPMHRGGGHATRLHRRGGHAMILGVSGHHRASAVSACSPCSQLYNAAVNARYGEKGLWTSSAVTVVRRRQD